MATDVALLAEVPFFQLLDENERAVLADQLDEVKIPAGQHLWEYGDPGGTMYIIRAGSVELFTRDDTGERIVLESVGPGEVFGEISLLDGGSRTASALVTEDLDALHIERRDLDQFLRLQPAAAMDLLAAMGKRIRRTAELLRHTASRNVNVEAEDKRTRVQKAADWIAEWSGSISFLMLHIVFFAVWIVLNVEWVPFAPNFDPFPFGLLTMVVSLEAIILSVFVLLSQNRQVAKDRIRSDVEYEVNLKAELEIAHLHEKVDRIMEDQAARLERLERLMRGTPAAGR
jgi:uncharacterized membrane protein